MANLTAWKPLHSAHAIQLAALTFTFHEPVGDVALKRAMADIGAAAEELGLTEQAPIGIALPQELISIGLQPAQAQGTVFTRREVDGSIGERLHVTRETIRFEDFAYIRWSPFKARARSLIEPALVRFADIVSIANISSDYIDVFQAANPSEKPDVSEVLNPSSSLIAAKVFRPTSAWHNHVGWFADDPPGDGRIVNINIDINDPEIDGQETRTARITSRVIDVFKPGDPNLKWEPTTYFDGPLDTAHGLLKGVLREVLTPAAADDISLG